jgi:ADP-ribose pyrophosphatase
MQDSDDDPVRTTNERIVFDDFFRIKAADVSQKQEDGTWTPWRRFLSFERGDAVSAIVTDSRHRVAVLVRQFRYPASSKGSGQLLELVAGMVSDLEAPEDAMRREMEEEIGYTPLSLTRVSTFFTSPGGSSERIVLFHAEIDLDAPSSIGGGLPGSGEVTKTVRLSYADVFACMDSGGIQDAKTLVGLMWLRMRTQSG